MKIQIAGQVIVGVWELFVVSIIGNNLVQIENDEKFRPKDFGMGIQNEDS